MNNYGDLIERGSSFNMSLSRSTNRFTQLIEQDLQQSMGGRFEVVEGVENGIAKALDVWAGIDILHISDEGIKGIGSRIQTASSCFGTFTIRMNRESGTGTEYEKRKSAMANGFIYPELTLQAYVNYKDELLSYAVVKTEDILKLIDDGKRRIQHTGIGQSGQASFYVVEWEKFAENGLPIYERQFTRELV